MFVMKKESERNYKKAPVLYFTQLKKVEHMFTKQYENKEKRANYYAVKKTFIFRNNDICFAYSGIGCP